MSNKLATLDAVKLVKVLLLQELGKPPGSSILAPCIFDPDYGPSDDDLR